MKNIIRKIAVVIMVLSMAVQPAFALENSIVDYMNELIDNGIKETNDNGEWISFREEIKAFQESIKDIPSNNLSVWIDILDGYKGLVESELKDRKSIHPIVDAENFPSADLGMGTVTLSSVEHRWGSDESTQYLLVGYTWTNNSNSATPFVLSFNAKAYKNGIQIEEAKVTGFEKNTITEVLPGYSITSYCIYKLEDREPIQLEVSGLYDVLGEYPPLTYTVEFQPEI